MGKQEFGSGREFFSEWHRDAFLEGCEREVLGAQRRLDELRATEGDTEQLERQYETMLENARAEIRRLTGQRGAAKRPAGAGKETR